MFGKFNIFEYLFNRITLFVIKNGIFTKQLNGGDSA